MATFTLPKNSKINSNGKVHQAEAGSKSIDLTPIAATIRAMTLTKLTSMNAARWCWTHCSRSKMKLIRH